MNREYIKRACEEIDAAVFSGDLLLDNEDRKELLEYTKRWIKAIEEQRCFATFHGVGGFPLENIQARHNLEIGKQYLVISGSIGQSRTVIELEGVKGSYNSVLFDIEGELPVVNPYMPVN